MAQSAHWGCAERCPRFGGKADIDACPKKRVFLTRMRHWWPVSAAMRNAGLCQLQSERNGLIASATKSGNSSCTESLPSGNTAVGTLGTDANASISARERDGV